MRPQYPGICCTPTAAPSAQSSGNMFLSGFGAESLCPLTKGVALQDASPGFAHERHILLVTTQRGEDVESRKHGPESKNATEDQST
jgi:hypothetical protein